MSCKSIGGRNYQIFFEAKQSERWVLTDLIENLDIIIEPKQ
jgi:hypothetical protein